jgi:Lrp/AsnC family transcriptional regulator, leucine-responsive regulatory protein
MDSIDCKIASLIQADGRVSCEKIGHQIGLSLSAVNDRIKKLQQKGVIIKWEARLCPEKTGLNTLAFLYVLIDEAPTFLDTIRSMPEILECHHITGEWSYLLKIRCRSLAHFEEILSHKIMKIGGIRRTESIIALSSPIEKSELPLELEHG